MSHRFLFACIAAALTVSVAACDDATQISLSDLQGYIPTPQIDPGDPVLQAVRGAGATLNAIDQAQDELEKALAITELAPIDKAIKLRPREPTYRFFKATMAIALEEDGDTIKLAAAEAVGVIALNHPTLSQSARDRLYYEGFLSSLIETSEQFSDTTDGWDRLNIQYCHTLDEYRSAFKADALPFPDKDC